MSFSLSDNEFRLFKDLIYEKSGIYFSEINKSILENRLYEVMLKRKFNNVMEFYDLIIKNDGELRSFLDRVTTNLTKFFRNEPQFDALKNYVFSDLMKKNDNEKIIKIWSAGCSTGEEPYTIAMLAHEYFGKYKDWQVKIIASDISLKSLLIAKEGYYDFNRVKNIPEKYLKTYFDKIGQGYRIKDFIKKMIYFDYHNLMHKASYKNLDIIFCRNVIIYFDKKGQEFVINKFYNLLKPYGYLFLGHSESLFGMNTKFKFNKIGNAITYLKEES